MSMILGCKEMNAGDFHTGFFVMASALSDYRYKKSTKQHIEVAEGTSECAFLGRDILGWNDFSS